MSYILHLLILINIYIVLISSVNLLVGVTKLLAVSQAAFFGIGAYVTASALINLNSSLVSILFLVVFVTSLSSVLVALPSLRLKGDYFFLATLGFQLIVFTVMLNWDAGTGGTFGIPGIPALSLLGGGSISTKEGYLVASSCLALATIGGLFTILHSPFGRV